MEPQMTSKTENTASKIHWETSPHGATAYVARKDCKLTVWAEPLTDWHALVVHGGVVWTRRTERRRLTSMDEAKLWCETQVFA
jgi:hypothetical protein